MQMKLEGGGVEGEHNTHCFQTHTHTHTFMQTYSSKGAERLRQIIQDSFLLLTIANKKKKHFLKTSLSQKKIYIYIKEKHETMFFSSK